MTKLNRREHYDMDAELLEHYHAGKLARKAAFEELRATCSMIAEVTGKSLESFVLPESWCVRPVGAGESRCKFRVRLAICSYLRAASPKESSPLAPRPVMCPSWC